MGTAQRFQLPSTGVVMQCDGYADASDLLFDIDSYGNKIPALIDYFLRRDRERFSRFVESMKSLIPGLEDVNVRTPDPQTRRIDLVIEKGFSIPASSASVGVRLMLFFAALAQHPTPPNLILLEEPENGVHPKRLADVMRLLRELTQGKHGQNAAQVILTTHSPYLLDHVNVEEDQVLVFRRNDDGSRSAEPADQERLRGFLDEFMLGEVWFNRGEEGLVAKKP